MRKRQYDMACPWHHAVQTIGSWALPLVTFRVCGNMFVLWPAVRALSSWRRSLAWCLRPDWPLLWRAPLARLDRYAHRLLESLDYLIQDAKIVLDYLNALLTGLVNPGRRTRAHLKAPDMEVWGLLQSSQSNIWRLQMEAYASKMAHCHGSGLPFWNLFNINMNWSHRQELLESLQDEERIFWCSSQWTSRSCSTRPGANSCWRTPSYKLTRRLTVAPTWTGSSPSWSMLSPLTELAAAWTTPRPRTPARSTMRSWLSRQTSWTKCSWWAWFQDPMDVLADHPQNAELLNRLHANKTKTSEKTAVWHGMSLAPCGSKHRILSLTACHLSCVRKHVCTLTRGSSVVERKKRVFAWRQALMCVAFQLG